MGQGESPLAGSASVTLHITFLYIQCGRLPFSGWDVLRKN